MKLFREIEEVAAAGLPDPVVTLGVFDGVHIGHVQVIRKVCELAAQIEGTPAVITFRRHPQAVIAGRVPKRITSLGHRLRIFEDQGVQAALVLEFGPELRETPAAEFARRVFHDAFRARAVVLGYNNRFGRDGEGNIDMLRQVGQELGFDAYQAPRVEIAGRPVSSTEIRRAILAGDLDLATSMLGRPVALLGTVVRGDALGRTLGYPTANLDVHHEVRPPRGVYGAQVRFDGGLAYGLVNIGVRPTLACRQPRPEAADPRWEERDRDEKIEVHILDADVDLYGRDLEVRFLVAIRPERRFESLEALKAGISGDEVQFREWLAGNSERPEASLVDTPAPPT